MRHSQSQNPHRQEPELVFGEEDRAAEGDAAQTERQNNDWSESGKARYT